MGFNHKLLSVKKADRGQFLLKATKMANLSPVNSAMDTIVLSLQTASEAAGALDLQISENLRSLLRLAASEAERVRKPARKPAAPKKAAAKAGKKRAKSESAAEANAAAPKQPKRGRKAAAMVNGSATH